MAWGRRSRGRAGEGVAGTAPAPTLGSRTHQDPRDQRLGEREAKRRLKRAEADIRRLERRMDRRTRAQLRRERVVSKRLKRIERSRRRPVAPLVGYLLVLNGLAAAAAILLLLWPGSRLYPPLLLEGYGTHWEMVVLCYVGAAAGTLFMLAAAPSVDYQQRARSSLYVYFASSIVVTFCGLLVAVVLVPMEGMDQVLLGDLVRTLLIVVACSGIPLPIVHIAAHWGRSRYFLSGRYHAIMGTLTAVFVVSVVLLAFFFLARQGWMEEVGYATAVAGGLGMVFPLPALAGTVLIEFVVSRRMAAARPY